jgi:glutamate-5-semialdehyde dehydrogenase
LIEVYSPKQHNIQVIKDLLAIAMGNPTPESIQTLLDKFYNQKAHLLLVALDSNNITGIIGIDFTKTLHGWITHIAVQPDLRKKSIGRSLIDYVFKTFSLKSLALETDEDAVDFYRTCGFTAAEIPSNWPGISRFRCIKGQMPESVLEYYIINEQERSMKNAIDDLKTKGRAAKLASRRLAYISTDIKNKALRNIADDILLRKDEILAANERDYQTAEANGMGTAMLDRLMLNESRLEGIAGDTKSVAALPDPVGDVYEMRTMPNGLQIGKKRVPIGVIGAIYESRPNVTVDITSLCLKSGNAVILRGGKETINSNTAIVKIIQEACKRAGMPAGCVQFIDNTDRALVDEMLKMNDVIDLIIPRGGAGLIRSVAAKATMPVVTGGIGVCHTYVDKNADIRKAVAIVYNAKVQRPTVCNALDTVLVHAEIAESYLPEIAKELHKAKVELHCDTRSLNILKTEKGLKLLPAEEADWGKEFLALKAAIRVVDSLDEAMEHIERYGSGHSEAIITEDYDSAMRFLNEVDAAAVYINASTRFTDGGQFGLGAEVGISTQKLHARGPMGLKELTTYKWIIFGSGQVRP